MLSFLDIMRTEYDGVEGYMMNALGFTKEEIETIRKHITTGDASPAAA